MIFIFPKWRLWNQIFQYMFAKKLSKNNESIFTIKMQYFDILDENNKKFIKFNWKKLFKYLNFWFDILFLILAKFRIITWIYQNKWNYNWYGWQSYWFYIKKWIINNLRYINWFYIYEWEHLMWKKININIKYIRKAEIIIKSLPKKRYNIIVHIRIWDYKNWSVLWKNDLTLPIDYYKDQINFFLRKYSSCNFIFLSDDIDWCKNKFRYIENSFFSDNDLWTDFSIMTQCNWWIISPSTISYIWTYFQNQKIEIFAPNYWLWFKSNIWYPEWIQTKKFSYVNII